MGYDKKNPELMRKLKAQEAPKAPAEITTKTEKLDPPKAKSLPAKVKETISKVKNIEPVKPKKKNKHE